MKERGVFAPESAAEARDRYEAVGPAAREIVREVARAMDMDREEYAERVTAAVVETARDALFASLLRVTVGTREEWEAWLDANDHLETVVAGSERVSGVAWHVAPFAGVVVAATFEDEPDAAVATLRRQAFGRVYRDRLEDR